MTWIFRSRKKNDRIDARQRVVLLRIKEVPPVHMPRREVRPWRVTIQHRRTVVNGITAVKNRIRAVLKAYGWAKEEENDSVITPNLLTGSNSQDFSTRPSALVEMTTRGVARGLRRKGQTLLCHSAPGRSKPWGIQPEKRCKTISRRALAAATR